MSASERAGFGLAWAWLLSSGCGEPREHPRFETEVGTLEIVETIPAPGSSDAGPQTRIDLCLSAEVDPRALDDFDATLHSADLVFDTQQEVQLFSWRAPGSRAELADTRWCPGSVLSLTPGRRGLIIGKSVASSPVRSTSEDQAVPGSERSSRSRASSPSV